MKKAYKLEDLDCANCASKMEQAIAKLDGVNKVTVSFMAQKLVLDADDARFDDILQQAVRCIKKVDDGCSVIL
ncbi:MAG: cation transporter [Clostridia bacterium]|nr:cation transporter [Clostridia bacterium]